MGTTILSLSVPIWISLIVLCLILGISIGLVTGYFIRVRIHEKSFAKTRSEAEKIIAMAEEDAEKKKKEAIHEAKQEIASLKSDADRDIKERRGAVVDLENKLNQREDTLDRRSINLDRREEMLNAKENKIDEKKNELEQQNNKVEAILKQQEQKLIEIAALTKEEARTIIMDRVREDMSTEIATFIKEEEEKARLEVKTKAKNILALAIQKYAGETAGETTVSTVSLPVEEMKGRIIGRE